MFLFNILDLTRLGNQLTSDIRLRPRIERVNLACHLCGRQPGDKRGGIHKGRVKLLGSGLVIRAARVDLASGGERPTPIPGATVDAKSSQ